MNFIGLMIVFSVWKSISKDFDVGITGSEHIEQGAQTSRNSEWPINQSSDEILYKYHDCRIQWLSNTLYLPSIAFEIS